MKCLIVDGGTRLFWCAGVPVKKLGHGEMFFLLLQNYNQQTMLTHGTYCYDVFPCSTLNVFLMLNEIIQICSILFYSHKVAVSVHLLKSCTVQ